MAKNNATSQTLPSVPKMFKLNSKASYSSGSVYEPTHQFSLVNQHIQVNPHNSFLVKFKNIWNRYKLPKVKNEAVYNDWINNPMQFWQNQLNFAVWCATTGCGVSKEHLQYKDPMVKSIFRFHTYYQIRRILIVLGCPLPSENYFDPYHNPIKRDVLEKMVKDFNWDDRIPSTQRLDLSYGLGSVRYNSLHGLRGEQTKILERGGDYDPANKWTVHIPPSGKFAVNDRHTYKIEYIEQYFKPTVIDSRHKAVNPQVGSELDAIGSFILDKSNGFTKEGILRINESIRTYVYTIVGAQVKTKTSIISGKRALEAQSQFYTNVDAKIKDIENIEESIDQYQDILQHARSKLDFVVGLNLYMIPSDMDLYIGTINGYNNLLTTATTNDFHIGVNDAVNSIKKIPPVLATEFDATPVIRPNLSDQPVTPTLVPLPGIPSEFDLPPAPEDNLLDSSDFDASVDPEEDPTTLTHEELKIGLTVGGIIIGTLALGYFK